MLRAATHCIHLHYVSIYSTSQIVQLTPITGCHVNTDAWYRLLKSNFSYSVITLIYLFISQADSMQRQYEDKHQHKTPWKYSKGEKKKTRAGRETREQTDLLCLDMIHLRLCPCLSDGLFPLIACNCQSHPLCLSVWPLNYTASGTGLHGIEVAPEKTDEITSFSDSDAIWCLTHTMPLICKIWWWLGTGRSRPLNGCTKTNRFKLYGHEPSRLQLLLSNFSTATTKCEGGLCQG